MAQEIDESIYDILSANDAVTDLVGSGDDARIYPDRFPQKFTAPAICYDVGNEVQENDLSGIGGLVYTDVTIICRAETQVGARTLARAVRLGGTGSGAQPLAGYKGTVGDLDIDAVRAGAVLICPVKTAGGGVYLGDMHALQGDGEIAGHTCDVSGTVTLQVHLLKGLNIDGPLLFPVLEDLPFLAKPLTAEEQARAETVAR